MDDLIQGSRLGQEEKGFLSGATSVSELFDQSIGILRRQYPIIALIVVCAVAIGFLYLFTAQKQYTAHALLVMDTSKTHVLQQQQQAFGDLPLDNAQVDTQIELMKSEGIGSSVVKDLKLTEDPEFVGDHTGIIGTIFRLISRPFFPEIASPQTTASEFALARKALRRFLANRAVRRVARTYVLDLSYTSNSPGRAAAVANAMAEAYIVDQLESKYQATRRASGWLQDRIAELRLQAVAADRAVLEFKQAKGIIELGSSGNAGNNNSRVLLSDQRVADTNTQLAVQRGAIEEAKARLDRVLDVIKQGVPDAAVTDSLHNEVINQMRTKYLELDRRAAIFEARYGVGHLAAVNIRTQMVQLRKSMADELGRIAESYKSDYEIAKARGDSLEASLARSIVGSQLTNRERLGLQELESKATVYHSIHDNFLQRYMEMSQQLSFPITESRVITSATAPGGPSSPQAFKALMIAGIFGLMLSFAAASFREMVDRVFRTTRQIETLLRTNCLAILPIVKNKNSSVPPLDSAKNIAPKGAGATRLIDTTSTRMLRQVLHEPLSSFAEGFRNVKVAVDINAAIKENKIIGITSSLPNEGKSTAAANLAELIAHAGNKTILVDCDLRNPTLSRKLIRKLDSDIGLLEVLGGKVELLKAVYTDELSGLHFLPAVIESRLAHSSDILASESLKQLLASLRKSYDYIVVDLPPLAPVVDVRATVSIIDSYVFVVEWGRTRINMVQHQLASAPGVFDRLLGVIMNKANLRILDRYESYYGKYYYKKYYGRYGYTS